MLSFRQVRVEDDLDTLIAFFTETASGEEEIEVDREDYRTFAKGKAGALPEGFVLAEQEGQTVGELVLRVMPYEGKRIGYVSFVYVIPSCRGKGYSEQLFRYAEDVFSNRGLDEYHLRVAQSNPRAIRFYEKQNLVRLCEEPNNHGQLCWRMGKKLG